MESQNTNKSQKEYLKVCSDENIRNLKIDICVDLLPVNDNVDLNLRCLYVNKLTSTKRVETDHSFDLFWPIILFKEF